MAFEPLIVFFAFFVASQPTVVALDPAQCHFFAKFSYTWTEYLALDSVGRYVWVDSQHMFVEV